MFLLTPSSTDISSAIVAWDIHTLQMVGKQQFPQGMSVTTITKNKAVLTSRFMPNTRSIYIWDLRSNQVYNFGSFSDLWLLHANADQNVLVTFEINWDVNPPETQQTKWTLTGEELLQRKNFNISLGGRVVEKNNFLPTHHQFDLSDKTVTLKFLVRETQITMFLTYDHSEDRLSLRWIDWPRAHQRSILGPLRLSDPAHHLPLGTASRSDSNLRRRHRHHNHTPISTGRPR